MTNPLATRSLYLCTPLRDDLTNFVSAVVRGGVDVVQLRDKQAEHAELVTAGRELALLCRDLGVPFVMNDSPELALEVGADGVHVGQDDVSVARCRELVGDAAIVGLSTHADAEFTTSLPLPLTYRSAGPIVPTPTKEGREPTGVDYAVRCATHSSDPVFVTGGVDPETIGALVAQGLRHFVVVRALTLAMNPEAEARRLRDALDEALANN